MSREIPIEEILTDPIYARLVEELPLHGRMLKVFSGTLRFVAELIHKTEFELMGLPGFNKASLTELRGCLAEIDQQLGTIITGTMPAEGLRARLESIRKERDSRRLPEPRRLSVEEVLANPAYALLIEELPLNLRIRTVFKCDNLRFVAELVQKTEAELMSSPNFKASSLSELRDVLEDIGVQLETIITGDIGTDELRTLLESARAERERGLPEHQRLLLQDESFKSPQDWLNAAKELVTPKLMERIGERGCIVIQGRMQSPPVGYKKLGEQLAVVPARVRTFTEDTVSRLQTYMRISIRLG